jgi:hypothetical protein
MPDWVVAILVGAILVVGFLAWWFTPPGPDYESPW